MSMTRLSTFTQFCIRALILLLLPLTWFSPYFMVRAAGLGLSVLGSVAWLHWRLRHGEPLSVPQFALPMAIFALWRLVSVAFAPLPAYGLKFALLDVSLLLLFFFFIDSLRLGWTINHWLTSIISVATFIVALELIPTVVWLTRWRNLTGALLPLPPVSFTLPGVLLTNPNVVSGFVNLLIPLILVKLFSASEIKRIGWVFLLLFFLLAEYLSGSRTGWVSLAAGVTVTLGVFGWQHIRQLYRWQIIAGLVALTGIGSIAIQQVFWRGKQPFIAARGDIWRGAWQLFTDSPIFGNGTASFAPLYAQTNAIPPGFVPSHAHNFLLQIIAENGLIGLVLVALGLWLAGKTLRIQKHTVGNQPFIAAWGGIGAAMALHFLGDYLLWHPIYTAFSLLLLAIATRRLPHTISLRHGNWLLATIIGALIAMGLWILRGNWQYEHGLAAARADDWISAQKIICAVAEQYPEKTLFGFQCGMASVRLADETGDAAPIADALPLALDALKREPYWPVHRANVAMMLWQAGQRADGFDVMQSVAEATPDNAIFALNAGWMAEELGRNDAAREWYSTAIEINPALANDVYFTMAPLRKSVPGVGAYRSPLADGWDALSEGLEPIAEMDFTIAVAKNPRDAEAWAGLAAAQLGLGEPAAEHSLATAQFISPNHFRVVGAEATFAHLNGDDARAAAILQNYVDGLAESSNHTNFYSQPYYFGAYNQVGLPFDLLPQFRRPLMDASMLSFIDWLKTYQSTHGGTP